MAFVKVAFSVLALLAAAEECHEADDVGLLQAKSEEKFPDLSKILGDGGAITKGIGSLTQSLADSLEKVNTAVEKAETTFNSSLATFNQSKESTATVVQNVTKFKTLIDQTISKYVPFYHDALDQVKDAMKTTKAVAGLIGHDDLVQKLDEINQTAYDKLGSLADASADLATEVSESAQDKFGDIVGDVKGKLGSLLSTTSSFRETFNAKLDSLMEALQAPLEIALGDAASTNIEKVKTQAESTLLNMEKFAVIVKTGLTTAADSVDIELTAMNNKGFFGRIFGGLFR